jgi:hypothetical protein
MVSLTLRLVFLLSLFEDIDPVSDLYEFCGDEKVELLSKVS